MADGDREPATQIAVAADFPGLLPETLTVLNDNPILGYVNYAADKPADERFRWVPSVSNWDHDSEASLADQLLAMCYSMAEHDVPRQIRGVGVDLRGWIYAAATWYVPGAKDSSPDAATLWANPNRELRRIAVGIDVDGALWHYIPGKVEPPQTSTRRNNKIAAALTTLGASKVPGGGEGR